MLIITKEVTKALPCSCLSGKSFSYLSDLIVDINIYTSLNTNYSVSPTLDSLNSTFSVMKLVTKMKAFIALLVATLAVAAQGSYIPSTWPASAPLGWNSWDGLNKWNTWNGNGIIDTPYTNSWASAWPAASLNNGWDGWYAPKTTVVQANIAKANPWGLQWGGYGHGYNNYMGAAPVAKYVTSNPATVLVAPLTGHALNQKLIVH
ncbi:uncharacterized protein LOC129774706 [Toxorhynchites rutilus septentrionalis]|uniref:uncharacterized protein LOC129774706 n=1 Tax=Toxorhynchites rutilus septentrionalis TaxID=329112 RepID=UPI00247AC55A|nr:uncharacterized protein LOC129774706 [Toxorhynchites rutilus septentrionalis]